MSKRFGWVLLALAVGACGDDTGGGGGGGVVGAGNDRGGPDALAGYTWSTKQSSEGIDFDFSFEFGTSTLAATNTCSLGADSLTAEIEVPVKYRYRAVVATGATAGDDSCNVFIREGTMEFELQGNKLIGIEPNGQTVEFTSTGARSGLYGEWSAEGDGITITWSMGAGKIKARATCPGGIVSPTATVNADFTNFVEITAGDTQEVGDESFNCSVGVQAGTMEYAFDGGTLVLTLGGQAMRFSPN